MDIIVMVMQCCFAFASLAGGLWFLVNLLIDLRAYRGGER